MLLLTKIKIASLILRFVVLGELSEVNMNYVCLKKCWIEMERLLLYLTMEKVSLILEQALHNFLDTHTFYQKRG